MSEEPRTLRDRLDPGRELGRQADGLGALASFLGPVLARLGVDDETLRKGAAAPGEYRALMERLEFAADQLSPLGWIVFELAPQDCYMEAAQMVADGLVAEAEEVIVADWNDSDALKLRFSVHRVQSLYRDLQAERWHLDDRDVGHGRAELVAEAIDNHRDGRYASATSIALAQIDGIVSDFADNSFFSRDRKTSEPRVAITDNVTLPGHPAGLTALHRLLTEHCGETSVEGRLLRHGIVHGRELGYGTLRNSTQALATLLAVIVWAQPLAKKRLADETEAREREYAGIRERDARGRQLDRRGFGKAKNTVENLHRFQMNMHAQHGRYGRAVGEVEHAVLFPDDVDGAQTAVFEGGNAFIAWSEAPSGFVFAMSGRPDEEWGWEYADYGAPDKPAPGPGWRHVHDERHPDWL